jgi:hypothetical protein
MGSGTRRLQYVLRLCGVPLVCACALHAQEAPRNGGDFSNNLHPDKLPAGEILVKGAWASASDTTTPLPESGRVSAGIYSNAYFGLTYSLPTGWTQKYAGPPPSDSGYYVLAQIAPPAAADGSLPGTVSIAAQDLFFTQTPAENALELVNYTREKLNEDYKVERGPEAAAVAGRTFIRFDYGAPAAELHWHVLATEIRCHVVKFVFMSRDLKLTDALIGQLASLKLPAEAGAVEGKGGGDAPVCIKDYANGENVIERDDPYFSERRFNPVPVRIIISKEGKVEHIHFLSAFPEQAKAIQDALTGWRFRPYLRDGKPVEVETGIMFGNPRRTAAPAAGTSNGDTVND